VTDLLATCAGGIIFSADSIRAIRDGRKTRTTRIINPQPSAGVRKSTFCPSGLEDDHGRALRLRYQLGKRYYVKEAWCIGNTVGGDAEHRYLYRLDNPDLRLVDGDGLGVYRKDGSEASPWLSPMRMPKNAARYVIEIADVQAMHLQDISEKMAREEGFVCGVTMPARINGKRGEVHIFSPLHWLQLQWDAILGKRAPWAYNPWVFSYTFHSVQP
jgi:hypothetical protein